MKQFKYKIYNPHIQSLEKVLTTEPIESDWEFIKVIPITEWEIVAVFIKRDW